VDETGGGVALSEYIESEMAFSKPTIIDDVFRELLLCFHNSAKMAARICSVNLVTESKHRILTQIHDASPYYFDITLVANGIRGEATVPAHTYRTV
jgi:hypothetical protein